MGLEVLCRKHTDSSDRSAGARLREDVSAGTLDRVLAIYYKRLEKGATEQKAVAR